MGGTTSTPCAGRGSRVCEWHLQHRHAGGCQHHGCSWLQIASERLVGYADRHLHDGRYKACQGPQSSVLLQLYWLSWTARNLSCAGSPVSLPLCSQQTRPASTCCRVRVSTHLAEFGHLALSDKLASALMHHHPLPVKRQPCTALSTGVRYCYRLPTPCIQLVGACLCLSLLLPARGSPYTLL